MGDKDIYIYGAKTIGRKIYTCIESFGINVQGFMVSNRYDNCNMLFGKEVYGIEDYTIINNRCVIKAFNNSHIHIHEGCMLDKDVLKLQFTIMYIW